MNQTIKAQLTGKRAPWIIGGLGLTAGYLWWTRRTPALDEPGAIDPATGEPWAPGSAGGSGSIGGGAPELHGEVNPRIPPTIPVPTTPTTPTDPADPADPADPPEPETNDQWVQRAINYLTARLFAPQFAQTALTKAQLGEPLSVAELAAVGFAFAGLGPPPQGFPPLGAAPLPAVPGTPEPIPLPNPNPGPLDPLPPIDPLPPPVDPPPPVPPSKPAGKFVALTQKFLGVNMGTSLVLDKLARDHGFPAILSNTKDRKVTNRTALDRIWYAPENAALRAKYKGDWTKLKAGDKVFIPQR